MLSQLVTDMRKISLRDLQFFYQVNCFTQGIMGYMLFISQCIQHDDFTAPYLFFFCIINPVGISDVGEFSKSETKYRHLQMPYQHGSNRDVANNKGFRSDAV